jgi:hypothetical protein
MRFRNSKLSHRYAGPAALAGLATAFSAAALKPAEAVPAFAGQTGYPCQQCHIGALGPQLTPFGREFKIKGYTIRGGEGIASKIPLALWVQSSYENYQKNLPASQIPTHYANNNNAGTDAISLFLAGGVNEHLGAFIQLTYDNTAKALFNDNTDIRVVDTTTIFGKDADIGLSFNNAPGIADPFNDNYIWGYPFISSFIGPGANASPILGGGQTQGNSYGVSAYAWTDGSIYTEFGLYETQGPTMMKLLGEAYGPGSSTGVEPYVNADYDYFWGNNNAHIGFTYFYGRYNPPNTFNPAFGTLGNFGHNTYNDLGIHNGYQWMGDDDVNLFTLDGYYYYEWQNLKGYANSVSPLFSTVTANNNLQEFRETGTYYYRQTYGGTISFDKVWGSKNNGLYNNGQPYIGDVSGKPDTTSITFEADWVPFGKENSFWPLRPFINLKLGLQYTVFTQFNGGTTNYDGYGRNASDNNTLFLFLWTVF